MKPINATTINTNTNIHFLSTLGKITYFSPLRDDCLPEADFVYLPGGYPELYLSELSMNSGMRESIHSFVEVGGGMWGDDVSL